MEAEGGAGGDERGGVRSPAALVSSHTFILFLEFIKTITVGHEFETVWTHRMLDTRRLLKCVL